MEMKLILLIYESISNTDNRLNIVLEYDTKKQDRKQLLFYIVVIMYLAQGR